MAIPRTATATVIQRTATRNPTDTMAATTRRAATMRAATTVTDRPVQWCVKEMPRPFARPRHWHRGDAAGSCPTAADLIADGYGRVNGAGAPNSLAATV